MIETGKILKVDLESIKIQLNASQHCEGCNLCNVMGDRNMVMEIPYQHGFKEGDIVELDIPDVSRVTTSIMVFILPLIGFITGVIVSQLLAVKLWNKNLGESYQLAFGFLVLVITFIALILYNRRLKGNSKTPRIIKSVLRI